MKKIIYITICLFFTGAYLFAFNTNASVDLTVNVVSNNEYLFDDLNSHFWYGEKPGWADEVTISWGFFNNRDCLKAVITNIGNNYGFFRTDHFFRSENWESPQITNVKCDIYLASGDPGVKVRLELKDNTDSNIEAINHPESLSSGTWITVTWTLNQSLDYSDVAKCIFAVDYLNGSDAVLYFDNLKIVDTSLNEYAWDDFDDKSKEWSYSDYSDVTNYSSYPWHSACVPVTHNNIDGPETNAGCLYLRWNAGLRPVEEYAQAIAENLNLNIKGYTKMEVKVRCTSSSALIKFGFDDSLSQNIQTDEKSVAVADQWETIEWDLPGGTFDWKEVVKIMFVVKTDVVAAGEVYIDNIKFLIE